jgi:hypothetical protein
VSTTPLELQRYLGDLHRDIGDSNAADHRPTYNSELDRATERATALYNNGLELLAAVDAAERARCQRFYKHQGGRLDWELAEFRAGGRQVVAPRYLSVLDEVRKLREMLV